MRLPYAPTSPPAGDEAAAAAYAAVAARRAPRPLQPLDLTLLHAPPLAQGWNAFLGAVRTQTKLPADLRELAICRVAALNGAQYEWHHHAPLLRAQGVGEEGVRSVLESPCLEPGAGKGTRTGKGLEGTMWVVVDYVDQMTRHVRVDDDVFAELKRSFTEREVVELTGVVAAYNCVSRFLVALDVGEGNDKKLVMEA